MFTNLTNLNTVLGSDYLWVWFGAFLTSWESNMAVVVNHDVIFTSYTYMT